MRSTPGRRSSIERPEPAWSGVDKGGGRRRCGTHVSHVCCVGLAPPGPYPRPQELRASDILQAISEMPSAGAAPSDLRRRCFKVPARACTWSIEPTMSGRTVEHLAHAEEFGTSSVRSEFIVAHAPASSRNEDLGSARALSARQPRGVPARAHLNRRSRRLAGDTRGVGHSQVFRPATLCGCRAVLALGRLDRRAEECVEDAACDSPFSARSASLAVSPCARRRR